MKKKLNGNTQPKTEWFGLILLVLTCASLLYIAQYSFCQTDEPFYLALAHRLYLGESLIVDEWHPTQMYSPILLPIYSLYKFFVPSGDSVILVFRFVRILLSFFVSVLLYLHLFQRYGFFPSTAAAIICQLYSRANINGCSYYNLFFSFAILTVVLADKSINSQSKRRMKTYAVLCGIAASLTVLCNPYFALSVLFIWLLFLIKGNADCKEVCKWVFAGILTSGIIYIAFLLKHTNAAAIIESFKYIFDDPAHALKTIDKVYMTVMDGLKVLGWQSLSALLVNCLVVLRYKKGKIPPHGVIILLVSSMAGLYTTLRIAPTSICFLITFPFTLMVFPLYLKHSSIYKVSFSALLYTTGILAAVSFMLASSTVTDAMTVGYAVCSVAGILMLFEVINESGENHKDGLVQSVLYAVLCLLVLVPCYCHRFIGIYRDSSFDNLNVRLDSGPACGLITTESHSAEYYKIYQTIMEEYKKTPSAEVMFSQTLPWAYLCTDWHYGSPSAWGNSVSNDLLEKYYSMHPEKVPDIVFIFEPEVAGYDTVLFNSHSARYQYEYQELDGWFYNKYIASASIIDQNEYVTVYQIDD